MRTSLLVPVRELARRARVKGDHLGDVELNSVAPGRQHPLDDAQYPFMPNPLRDRSAGLLILLITPSLTEADPFLGLIELLEISPRHEDMLILTRDVRPELSGLASALRISLEDWESEDLMRGPAYILRWMVSRGFGADLPEATSKEIMAKLLGKVADLPFTSRTQAALRNDNIIYVGDLVMRTEAELLRMLGLVASRCRTLGQVCAL